MYVDLSILYAANKSFPSALNWQFRDNDWMAFVSPLDVDGVTIEGFRFRATANRMRPDEHVTFQLEYLPPRRHPKGGAIARVDWKPLTAHNNKMVGPDQYKNVIQRCTHHHEFWLNWQHSEKSVWKGNLEISVPVEPEQSFEEIVAFVGKEFKISNIEWLPTPPWSATLF